MTEEANVVALYPDHDAAEQAVAKLRDASFDVMKLSIIGKTHTEESVVGYDTTWERMKYWGLRGAFRGGIWGLLLGGGFFLIPGVSPADSSPPTWGACDGIGVGSDGRWPFSTRGQTHSSWDSERRYDQVRKYDHIRQVPCHCAWHARRGRAGAPDRR